MVKIYTDGAYAPTRNKGGWAFIVIKDNKKIHSSFFGEENTTNNRMEIQAVIEAIIWARENKLTKIEIFTDSMYVIGTMSKNWKRNKNHDLWEILDELVLNMTISWNHVKGHEGDRYNELCDALAVEASK